MQIASLSRFQSFQPFPRVTVPPPELLSTVALTISLPDRAAADQIAGSIAARFPYLAEASNLDLWLQPVASALSLDTQTQFGGRDLSSEPELVDYLIAALRANLADSLGDQWTVEQMRLQQTMERISKFTEALSAILKKMSDTSQTIVDNLK
jgi:hypothetical protein